LPQPRTLAHRIGNRTGQAGEAAKDSARETDSCIGHLAAETECHRAAVEIQRGRKYQQQRPNA
jgi:hypothetical protein